MTSHDLSYPKLLALREGFDRTFAEHPTERGEEHLDFLAVRIGGEPYLLCLSEIQSLHVGRKLVSAPSRLSSLVGLAGFRGVLTPVYDLGQLLGYPASPFAKWLAVVRAPAPIGLVFGGFDGHLRVPPSRLSVPKVGAGSAIGGAVEQGDKLLPLLHLPTLIEDLTQRIKTYGSLQER